MNAIAGVGRDAPSVPDSATANPWSQAAVNVRATTLSARVASHLRRQLLIDAMADRLSLFMWNCSRGKGLISRQRNPDLGFRRFDKSADLFNILHAI